MLGRRLPEGVVTNQGSTDSTATHDTTEPGQPLLMYIAVTENSLGALIAQEKDGVERPVYYLSRLVRSTECNYSLVENQCMALVYVAQRLRHYMLAHKVCLMSKRNPFRYMMNNPIPSS